VRNLCRYIAAYLTCLKANILGKDTENPGADSLQLPGMETCHTDLSVGRSCATHI
jgi:hypothetical protein